MKITRKQLRSIILEEHKSVLAERSNALLIEGLLSNTIKWFKEKLGKTDVPTVGGVPLPASQEEAQETVDLSIKNANTIDKPLVASTVKKRVERWLTEATNVPVAFGLVQNLPERLPVRPAPDLHDLLSGQIPQNVKNNENVVLVPIADPAKYEDYEIDQLSDRPDEIDFHDQISDKDKYRRLQGGKLIMRRYTGEYERHPNRVGYEGNVSNARWKNNQFIEHYDLLDFSPSGELHRIGSAPTRGSRDGGEGTIMKKISQIYGESYKGSGANLIKLSLQTRAIHDHLTPIYEEWKAILDDDKKMQLLDKPVKDPKTGVVPPQSGEPGGPPIGAGHGETQLTQLLWLMEAFAERVADLAGYADAFSANSQEPLGDREEFNNRRYVLERYLSSQAEHIGSLGYFYDIGEEQAEKLTKGRNLLHYVGMGINGNNDYGTEVAIKQINDLAKNFKILVSKAKSFQGSDRASALGRDKTVSSVAGLEESVARKYPRSKIERYAKEELRKIYGG